MMTGNDVSRLRENRVPPYRRMKTVAMYSMFLIMGLSNLNAVLGTSLLDMEILLESSTAQMSMVMSAKNLGGLLAAFLCALLFDRFNPELQFSAACLMLGCSIVAAPWFPHVYGFVAAVVVWAVCTIYSITGGTVYFVQLWGGDKRKEPLLQAVQFTWSIGSTLSPFLVQPFLVTVPSCGGNITHMHHANENTSDLDRVIVNENFHSTDLNSTSHCFDKSIVDFVRYAYLLIGSFCLVPTMCFGWLFVVTGTLGLLKDKEGWQYTEITDHDETKNNKVPQRSSNHRKWFAFLIIFHVLYPIVEDVFGTYIAVFVVKSLGWGVKQGATITSVFYGAVCVGRLLAIPATKLFEPPVMIAFSLILACVSYLAMLFSSSMHYLAIYLTVIMAGIAVSTLVASKLLWVSQYLVLSGFVLGVCQAAGAVGAIIIFPLVGYLIQNVDNMWLMYVVLTASLLQLLMLGGVQCCIKHKLM